MLYKKYTTPIIASVLAGVLELFLFFYQWYVAVIIIGVLVMIVSTWSVIIDSIFSKRFILYLTTPLAFLMAVLGFLAINEVAFFNQLVVFLSFLLFYLYFESVYLFNFNYQNFHQHSIENVSGYMNLLTVFLMSVCMYAAHSLIGLPFWVPVSIVIFFFSAILIQSFWVADLPKERSVIYFGVLLVILIELFWAYALLPTNFYTHGFLLTASYYCMWGLSKSSLLDILSGTLIRRYLLITFFSILMVVLSTAWL